MRRLIPILVAAVAFTSTSVAQAQTGDALLDSLNAHIDARTDSLRQRVADLEAKVETLEGSDDDARLDALEGAFASIPDQLAALDIRVTDIEDWIAAGSEPEPTPTPTPEPTPEPTPTPTPTPTPDPEPTRTNRCFSDPGACGFPDPDYGTVGVPAGTDLAPSGGFTVTTPGAVIDGLDVRGVVRVAADNVTIKNSRFNAPTVGSNGTWMIVVDCDCDTLVQNVEFTTDGSNRSEFAVRNDVDGVLTLDRVYQHGAIDAMAYCGSRATDDGGCIIKDTYSIIEKVSIPGDHLENVYLDNSTVSVQHSVILLAQPQTSTVFGNVNNGTDGPCQNTLTINNSLLAGGGQMITACAHGTSDGSANVRITNNRFARCGNGAEVQGGGGTWLCPGLPIGQSDGEGYYPNGGSFMVCTAIPSNALISGNVWDKDDSDADARC